MNTIYFAIARPSKVFRFHMGIGGYRCPAIVSLVLVLFAWGGGMAWAQHDTRAQHDTMEVMLDAVTVSAGALPVQLGNATRAVEIIDARAIRAAAPLSVDDALRAFSAAFVQRRGTYGTQSDLSLRGGTFGQTLVLLDGLRVSDPQTGHHALQLPIPVTMLDRIEVLPGHGSALLGADALGGAVNIVPSRLEHSRLGASLEGGSFGLRRAAVDAAYALDALLSHTAAEYAASDGWRDGTAFTNLSLAHLSRIPLDGGELSLLAGYADRDFGAFDFYSPGRGIPSHERVRVGHAAVRGRVDAGALQLRAALSYRDLRDRFQFDTRIPDRFINEHHTQVFGGEIRGLLPLAPHATLSLGIEAAADRITSSSLGDHERAWLSASAAGRWQVTERMDLDGGLRLDVHREHAPQFNPTLGVLFRPAEAWMLRGSVGRSFRMPTYTDRYYSDPVSVGNPSLQPESAWSVELGTEWIPARDWATSVTLFHRDQRALIDYVQQEEGDPFVARNFTAAVVRGTEMKIRWSGTGAASLTHAEFALSLLATDIDTRGAYRTRYALSAPSRLLRLRLGGRLAGDVEWSAIVIGADQQLARDYLTADARLRRSFGSFALFLAADNLTNSAIEEFSGLPLPGRWLRAGVEVGIGAP